MSTTSVRRTSLGSTAALLPGQRSAPSVEKVVVAPARLAGSVSLVRLMTGHGLATLAQTTTSLAAGAYALERTGSASWASLTVALGVLPYVALSGLAGLLADLRPRQVVLAWSCGLRAVLIGGSAALMLSGGPVGGLVVLAVLSAVAATPAYPALSAAVPQCVPDETLERWNAVATGVENLAWLVGPGLFGVLLALGVGPAGISVTAGVVCAVAVATLVGVHLPAPAQQPRTGWASEVLAGLRVVAARRPLRAAMGLAMVDNFLYGYVVVTLVLLGTGGVAQGVMSAAMTAGALVAVVVAGWLARVVPTQHLAVGGLVVFAAALVGVGVLEPGVAAVVLVVVAGSATLVAEIAAVTLLQRGSEAGVLARVFGVYDQLNVGAIAVGSALAGPLAQGLGPGPALLGVTAGAGVVTAVLTGGLRRTPSG